MDLYLPATAQQPGVAAEPAAGNCTLPTANAPVAIFCHGGVWASGARRPQIRPHPSRHAFQGPWAGMCGRSSRPSFLLPFTHAVRLECATQVLPLPDAALSGTRPLEQGRHMQRPLLHGRAGMGCLLRRPRYLHGTFSCMHAWHVVGVFIEQALRALPDPTGRRSQARSGATHPCRSAWCKQHLPQRCVRAQSDPKPKPKT